MEKFIVKTAVFSLLILSLLLSINYWGDGARLFHAGYEDKIVEIIFSNQNATNISNYDDRILQKKLINKLSKSPDILILGSSRTMLINSTYFNDKKVINNSVTGTSIEDLIAIFQMYNAKKILPKKIILGVDPWLFNENNEKIRWRSLKEEYESFRSEKSRSDEGILSSKTKQLFSFSYFQASLKNLPNIIVGKSEPQETDKIYNESNTKLVDGALSYGKTYREATNKEINLKAQKYISRNIYAIENYKKISPRIFTEFERLCLSIINNDIELSFFLAPYHPIAFETIAQDYPIVMEAEARILEFAKEKNIECYGSFNPKKIGVGNQGFLDGMHSKEKTIQKILKVTNTNNSYKSIGEWQ